MRWRPDWETQLFYSLWNFFYRWFFYKELCCVVCIISACAFHRVIYFAAFQSSFYMFATCSSCQRISFFNIGTDLGYSRSWVRPVSFVYLVDLTLIFLFCFLSTSWFLCERLYIFRGFQVYRAELWQSKKFVFLAIFVDTLYYCFILGFSYGYFWCLFYCLFNIVPQTFNIHLIFLIFNELLFQFLFVFLLDSVASLFHYAVWLVVWFPWVNVLKWSLGWHGRWIPRIVCGCLYYDTLRIYQHFRSCC